VSEWTKPDPEPKVVSWLNGVDEDAVFLSVITIAELRRGVELLSEGRRRDRLADWIAEDLTNRFEERILDVDRSIADNWGKIMATSHRIGRGLTAMDGFFAATATVHGMILATRNSRDFAGLEVEIFNPWSDS
jgi:hypothetical protein